MTDEVDMAHEAEMAHIARLLHSRVRDILPVTGRCHNCQTPVGEGALFCDADCRDDDEKRRRFQQHRGPAPESD